MIFNSNNKLLRNNSCMINQIEIKSRKDKIKMIEMINSIEKIVKINKINMINSLFNKNMIIKINTLKDNKNSNKSKLLIKT